MHVKRNLLSAFGISPLVFPLIGGTDALRQASSPGSSGTKFNRNSGFKMDASAYRFPSRRELTRMPALASTVLHFNLPGEILQLRAKDSWQRGTGRSSKTLAKYPDFHVVLVLMKANTRMNEHHVDARISISRLGRPNSCPNV